MFSSLRQLHWYVYALSFASGVIMAGFMMLLPLLPAYARDLGFSEYEIGLLVAAFFIGRVLFQFPLGILSDYTGRRKIIWASLALFTLSTSAYALTNGVVTMILLRLVQGVAASGFVVASQSYINDCSPPQYRGLANGVMSSAINAGVVVGPVLGGLLSQAFSLSAPFWSGGALGLICFFVTLAVPSMRHPQGPAEEWEEMLPRISRFKRMLATVWCPPALLLSSIHFLNMMAVGILITAVPVLTAEVLGWSANEIALALAFNGAVAAVSSPYLGRLADTAGRVWVMASGLAVLSLEGLFVFLHPGTPATMLVLAVGGAGAPAYFNALYSLEGDVTTPKERGALTGFVGSFGEWGSIIGSSLLTPFIWVNISVSAPMALQAAVLAFAVLLALSIRPVLEKQITRKRGPA